MRRSKLLKKKVSYNLHWCSTIAYIQTIILPVVLYGCESWSLILREERVLRMSENREWRRIFGLRRNEVTG
jgi:hypothetical protein